MAEPIETEAGARALPGVRDAFDEFGRTGRLGTLEERAAAMLLAPFAEHGVPFGAYEERILRWLAGFEVHDCAMIADLFRRFWEAGYETGKANRDD